MDGVFECLPCAEGCESCEDDSPCVVSLNWLMRTAILILECCVIACLPAVALFTWKYGNVKVSGKRFSTIWISSLRFVYFAKVIFSSQQREEFSTILELEFSHLSSPFSSFIGFRVLSSTDTMCM